MFLIGNKSALVQVMAWHWSGKLVMTLFTGAYMSSGGGGGGGGRFKNTYELLNLRALKI